MPNSAPRKKERQVPRAHSKNPDDLRSSAAAAIVYREPRSPGRLYQLVGAARHPRRLPVGGLDGVADLFLGQLRAHDGSDGGEDGLRRMSLSWQEYWYCLLCARRAERGSPRLGFAAWLLDRFAF